MWHLTEELDDLQQRDNYLVQTINAQKGAAIVDVFRHLHWNVATRIRLMEIEQRVVREKIWVLSKERGRLFLERPEGPWIREVSALVGRNGGRDFWEERRKDCVLRGGCCGRGCRCCVGWLLHCGDSCPCCVRRKMDRCSLI